MDNMIQQYLAIIGGWKILSIAVLIALDTIMGIILAIKNKTFQWSKIASFMNTSVLEMFGGYFLLGIFAMAEPTFQAVVPTTLGIIDVKLVADSVTTFQAFVINPQPTPSIKK